MIINLLSGSTDSTFYMFFIVTVVGKEARDLISRSKIKMHYDNNMLFRFTARDLTINILTFKNVIRFIYSDAFVVDDCVWLGWDQSWQNG